MAVWVTTPAPTVANTVETFATLPARFEDISVGPDDSLYMPSQPGGGVAYSVDLDGNSSTIATGLLFPLGGVVDAAGNYYVSCFNANHIHKIEPDGTKSVFAGSVNTPTGLLLSEDEQTLYVACYNLGHVMAIDLGTGISTVIANGPSLLGPDGLARDEAGNLYIANFLTSQITKLDTDGNESVLVTLPGSQTGYIDYRDGSLYVAGIDTHRIYEVDVVDGSYTILAGTGVSGTTDGPAESARISNPNGLALSNDGLTLWFQSQNLLRRVVLDDPASTEELPEVGGTDLGSLFVAPNPFHGSTRIEFSLSTPKSVDVTVYTATGSRIRNLASGKQAARSYTLVWDGQDDAGRAVSDGVYYVRADLGGREITQRVVLVR